MSGSHFTFSSPGPGLVGLSFWGSPTPQDVAELSAVLDSRAGTFSALIDTVLVKGVRPETFEALAQLVTHRACRAERMVKVALVRANGIVGTVAGGLLEVARGPFPLQAFSALEPAAEWLGAPKGWAQRLQAERDALTGVNPLLARLRETFRQLGAVPTTSAHVARRLALSQRTLVRRLSELGTSFHHELIQHRVSTAQQMMRETDAPLGAIAVEAGFGTFSRFCTAFRQATGQTPASWRGGGDVAAVA